MTGSERGARLDTDGMAKSCYRILFLCTGNACRSQMAEAWTRHLLGDLFEAHSAGVSPHGLDPRATAVMKEAGVDMSAHYSKSASELLDISFDLVVTMCDNAAQSCPDFTQATRTLHHNFSDPPKLAKGAGTEEEALAAYRRVRDEIRGFVHTLPQLFDDKAD
ncbi:MAG: arsenate reductase ArsC [Gammaproteobacteria bacterium]